MTTPPDTIGARAARGFAWSGLQMLLVRVLSLATFVVLARLLTPRDYGIAAIAGVVAALVAILTAAGYSQALVHKAEIDEEDVDSVFWVSVTIGGLLAAATVAASWPLAAFLDLPELRAVLWAMSPMFLAIAATSVQTGLMQRAFRFRELARIAVATNLAATCVGITVALLGAGYWALVVQTALVPVGTSLCLWVVHDYRPGRRVSWARYREVFATSRQIMGTNLMTFGNEQTDKLVVGHRLGSATLGVYSVAYRVVFILLDVVSRSVQLVALPSFARLSHDRERLRRAYFFVARLAGSVSFPLFAFGAVSAGPITAVLFGDQWSAAVPAMRVFCVYGALQSLLDLNAVFLQSQGRARLVLRLAAAGMVLQVGLVVLAAPHGIAWAAASFVARTAVMAPLLMAAAARQVGGIGPVHVARTVAPPALASGALVLACLGAARLVGSHDVVVLLVSVPVAALAYLAVLAAVGRTHLRDLARALALVRHRTDPDPAPAPGGVIP